MADVTITYKGANIATMDATGSKTLQTAGTYCEGDIGVEYVKPGGGGPVSVPAKEVNFRDYDGTVVYSYTPAEFAALSAMPANPDHSGDEIPLTAQGWNWSFADAQAYVAKYGRLEVGQMYITTDGVTVIDIELPDGRTSPYLGLAPNGTVRINWGDGTSTLVSGTSLTTQIRTQHSYAAPGKYSIRLRVNSGTVALFGDSVYGLLNKNMAPASGNRVYSACVRSVRIGDNISIGDFAFNCCYRMLFVTIPSNMASIGGNAFSSCYMLPFVTIPSGILILKNRMLNICYSLSLVSIPNSVTEIESSYVASSSQGLSTVIIPDSVTSIGDNAFSNCYCITNITIPDSVVNIDTFAFSGCFGLGEIHFFRNTPPTLASWNCFANIPSDCIIYVPYSEDHSILEAYKTATNWSTYASHMQEEPQ